MSQIRLPIPSSTLRRDFRFVRTLQAPDHIVPDKKTGQYRISSKAFGPSSSDGSLSGDLEQALAMDGLDPLAMYPAVTRAVGAAALLIGHFQDLGCAVEHKPVPTNWYHGGALGTKSKSVREKLRLAAEEIVPIDQIEAARWFASIDASAALPGSSDST